MEKNHEGNNHVPPGGDNHVPPGLPEIANENSTVRIDLPPAIYAGFHTLAYENPNGFKGILIGDINKIKKITQSDHVVEETCILSLRVEATMLVKDPSIFAPGAQWKQNLVNFCQKRIPTSMRLSDVQILGLISYHHNPSPDNLIVDKKMARNLYRCDEAQKPKIVVNMDSFSREENSSHVNGIKACIWDSKGWRENIPINILKLVNLAATDYMKARPGSTFYSGDKYKEPANKECLRSEMDRSQDNVKKLAKKIFEQKKKNNEK